MLQANKWHPTLRSQHVARPPATPAACAGPPAPARYSYNSHTNVNGARRHGHDLDRTTICEDPNMDLQYAAADPNAGLSRRAELGRGADTHTTPKVPHRPHACH